MKKDNENLYTFLYTLKGMIRVLSQVIMVLVPLAIGTGAVIDSKEKKQKEAAEKKNNNK